MSRREDRCAACLAPSAADNTARWIAGTAVYQVGRNSFSQPKNAAASKPGVQTTLEPAANAADKPGDQAMPMEQRQHAEQSVPRSKCQGRRQRCGPIRQTLAWVSGTVFGRDVLPEVNRINASSVLDANSSSPSVACGPPTILNAPAPPCGRVDRSMMGMPRAWATARLAESMSARVNSAAKSQFAEIALAFIIGEARIERHTNRTGCNRDQSLPQPLVRPAILPPPCQLRPTPRLRSPRTTSFARVHSAP